MRRVPQKWRNETNEMSDSNLSSITKTYFERWNMLRLTDNSRRRDLKAELFVGSQSQERAKLFSMNTYCLALNRRRKTNSIPGQSSPRISPFKYTAGEKAPCELEGWRTKENRSLECHVERLHEGDGPSPARARASTSCDPQGATLLSAAGCTTAPARWIPPHRRPPSQPHGLLQAFPEWWERGGGRCQSPPRHLRTSPTAR